MDEQNLQPDLSSEADINEIESYCINCEKQGVTRLLLTRIPFFKEIVLMSFSCPHCAYKNTEVQPSGIIQEKGIKIELKLKNRKDLNRQAVKMESALLRIPELEFEVPAATQRGSLNTIEGFITSASENLKQTIELNKDNPDIVLKLTQFVAKLDDLLTADENENLVHPFTFIVEDTAGNSTIENVFAPAPDPNMTISHFSRTTQQDLALGLQPPVEENSEIQVQDKKPVLLSAGDAQKLIERAAKEQAPSEVLIFPATCSLCREPGESRMLVIDIPYFKEVVIMAFACEKCGYKTNEVKPGGAISPKGKKISLIVNSAEDLNRDILKSETAQIAVPELHLVLEAGTLGGKFTTIEGLLTAVLDQMKSTSFLSGDSAEDGQKQTFENFLTSLKKATKGEVNFTITIDDPVANSYIQNVYAPDPDPNMIVEEYERSFDQNEELGLNDIKTENY
eukprot:TRINITY_DN2705_c0_g1_i1.p1 TRINITY_DN2705_c0_g1~~TRINITY_DN2705_c0_g1_i1.p1  ORF type:complete len:468 (-),score=130.12 TRINITY_DN2705_c0_g1_i1:45-1400(-)